MSTNQFIVRGEAAESDSDDEQLSEKKPASIIDGEASESDDDPETFNLKPLSLRSTPATPPPSVPFPEELSLLQSKLVEANIALYTNLTKFVRNTCENADRDLRASNQMLQTSQVQLQVAAKTIKNIDELSAQLLEKSTNVLTSNFLSNVKINRKE